MGYDPISIALDAERRISINCADLHRSEPTLATLLLSITAQAPYAALRCGIYLNGNLHILFERRDLVAKANKIVADYYGEVLPDARRKVA